MCFGLVCMLCLFCWFVYVEWLVIRYFLFFKFYNVGVYKVYLEKFFICIYGIVVMVLGN